MTYLKEIHIEICNELSRTRTKMASSQMRGFVWKSAWDTPKGQVHCSEEPKWWWELRGFDKLLGALIGFVGRVYNP